MNPKIQIKDSLFSHAFSSSNWFKPSYFEWDFNNHSNDILIFTDKNLFQVDQFNNKTKIAWLVESPVITPDAYEFINNKYNKFTYVFTHFKKILDNCPNAKPLPIGGSHLDENEINLYYDKTKLISMMYSFKRFAPGHEIRFQIADKYKSLIDIMGSGLTGTHLKKIHSCKDYAFSIVIENCKEDYYFTEKIIDCFLSGTIPIYWGCPSIGHFFNKKGFYTFDNTDELYNIIKNKDSLIEFYSNNLEIIRENYNIALKYKIAEDYMWNNYKDLIYESK